VLDPSGGSHSALGAVPDGIVPIFPANTYRDVRIVFDGVTIFFFVDIYCLAGFPAANMGTATNNDLTYGSGAFDPTKTWTLDSLEFNGVA
jgi:hypothetical protein